VRKIKVTIDATQRNGVKSCKNTHDLAVYLYIDLFLDSNIENTSVISECVICCKKSFIVLSL